MSEYKSFQDILNFLSFSHKFETKGYPYPFTQDPNNVIFSLGQIIIPKFGIREMVQNKISDIKSAPISEITMMYQIPFVVIDKKEKRTFDEYKSGVVNQNISLTFRYDKTYKYGDITKSIFEVCYYITEHAEETNDFFILTFDNINDFFSYYIIPNQWGLGSTICNAGCQERYYGEKQNASEKFPKLHKCPFMQPNGVCNTNLPMEILKEIDWFFRNKKNYILPIGYPQRLEELVHEFVNGNVDKAERYLNDIRSMNDMKIREEEY